MKSRFTANDYTRDAVKHSVAVQLQVRCRLRICTSERLCNTLRIYVTKSNADFLNKTEGSFKICTLRGHPVSSDTWTGDSMKIRT